MSVASGGEANLGGRASLVDAQVRQAMVQWLDAKLGTRGAQARLRVLLLELQSSVSAATMDGGREELCDRFHLVFRNCMEPPAERSTTDQFDCVVLILLDFSAIKSRDFAVRDALWSAGESTPCIIMTAGSGGAWAARELWARTAMPVSIRAAESAASTFLSDWATNVARSAGRTLLRDSLHAALDLENSQLSTLSSSEDPAVSRRQQQFAVINSLFGANMASFAQEFPRELGDALASLRAESLHNVGPSSEQRALGEPAEKTVLHLPLEAYILGRWDQRLVSSQGRPVSSGLWRDLVIPGTPAHIASSISGGIHMLSAAADRGLAAVAASFGATLPSLSRPRDPAPEPDWGLELPLRPGRSGATERFLVGPAWHAPALLHASVSGGAVRYGDGSMVLSPVEALFPSGELRFCERTDSSPSHLCPRCDAAHTESSSLRTSLVLTADSGSATGVETGPATTLPHTRNAAADLDPGMAPPSRPSTCAATAPRCCHGPRDGGTCPPAGSFDPCFPHGNSGLFFNAGLAQWHSLRAAWRLRPPGFCPPPPPRIPDFDALCAIIEDPTSRVELPRPVRLSDMVECCQDTWDVPNFTESDGDW